MLARTWLVLWVALAGCSSQQRVTAETFAAAALIPDDQENALGEQVHAELGNQGIRYLQNATATDYVNGLVEPILAEARKQRPGVDWHVHVVDEPGKVNAFATPGGHIYVLSGLLTVAGSDAEVAGVLAHEAGHVVARHSARQLVTLYGLQTVAALALGNNPELIKQIAATLATQGVMLAHSRASEREADEHGARIASSAGYDPHGLLGFLGKLRAKEGRIPQVLTWLSDHPATSDRITHLNAFVDRHNLKGTRTESGRLAQVREQVGTGQARN